MVGRGVLWPNAAFRWALAATGVQPARHRALSVGELDVAAALASSTQRRAGAGTAGSCIGGVFQLKDGGHAARLTAQALCLGRPSTRTRARALCWPEHAHPAPARMRRSQWPLLSEFSPTFFAAEMQAGRELHAVRDAASVFRIQLAGCARVTPCSRFEERRHLAAEYSACMSKYIWPA